ncbi:hypothetical protein HPC49_39760 [Pyxidicoccus fallax]|uniref:Lipoprotein n=1 Tax=Pyxidicoccus fallax TaxID=394095 RepID=A0A848M0F0_9BACT|nr:hypothetical protein [Pyxidicoccus fallax]NMO23320.1 hypothetical protein [Pyxidicoccus fallax]NPC84335.1 hypothetical protein [Pyxidicoccus fallax]
MRFSGTQLVTGLVWLTALTTACGDTEEAPPADVEFGDIQAFAEEALPGAPTATVFSVDKPGQVRFDATGDKVVFQPASPEPMRFGDWKEFAEFAHTKLNARVHYHPKTGELEGVSGDYAMAGAPVLVDGETKSVHDVINPVGAFLGGLQGYIHVGDERICVRPELCGDVKIPPVDRVEGKAVSDTVSEAAVGTGTFCNASGFCIRGYSINVHTLFHLTNSVTERVSGGTRTERFFCWRGFIPWVCTRQVGESHSMRVGVTYVDLLGTAFSGGSSSANNSEKVERGSFWIGPFNPFNPPTAVRAWATCGAHSGSTLSGGTGTRTSDIGVVRCP